MDSSLQENTVNVSVIRVSPNLVETTCSDTGKEGPLEESRGGS